ncbi:LCP family protein [Gottfriedia sp. NPDC056225]|uniref:LCP family protein n=1 Tax=Gottfriedia sp. NPDC056225 TaxID=3345751 RepID=UPI0015599EDD|nr:LCP family protein [Arthrobacter citreus]
MKEKPKKIRKTKRKSLKILLSLVIILIAFIGYKGIKAYFKLQNATQGEVIHSSMRNQELKDTQPFSILFLGIENYSTKGQGGRTDTIILATVNPKDKTVEKMSIPRDTYVEIPDQNKKSKINGAYNSGLQSSVNTVENFLHVPIDYYVTVDFGGFKNIVDEVGGINVDVPFDFWQYTDTKPRYKVYFKKGNQHLNGTEALAYARMRKRDPRGDFGREERQQQAMLAIIDKIKSPETLFKIDKYASVFSKNVKTNMSLSEGLFLFNDMKETNSKNITTLKLDGKDDYIDRIYYYMPDQTSVNAITSSLRNHLELDKSQANSNSK